MMADIPASALDDPFAGVNTIPSHPQPSLIDSRNSLYTKFDPLAEKTPKQSSLAAHIAAARRAQSQAAGPAQSDKKLLDFATPEHPAPVSRTAAPVAVPVSDLLAELDMKPVVKTDELDDPLALSSASDGALHRPSSLSPHANGDRLTASAGLETAPRSGLRYTEADLRRRVEEAVKAATAEIATKQQSEVEALRAQLAEERKNGAEMKLVVDQFEQAMMAMMSDQKTTKTDAVVALEAEKAQLATDLNKTEQAFADLHHKYEKLKEVSTNLRKNEETLKGTVETAQQALKKAEERYEQLKSHAQKKIEGANTEIANVREQYKNEIKVLSAKMKLIEAELTQTQRKLAAKEQDNKELTAICDDMLKQLESRNQ
eukprot:m.230943 g.230943  ORF g.230943 m.230943 type:complete len:373 (+) comp12137_c0_seq1:3-1121(+)